MTACPFGIPFWEFLHDYPMAPRHFLPCSRQLGTGVACFSWWKERQSQAITTDKDGKWRLAVPLLAFFASVIAAHGIDKAPCLTAQTGCLLLAASARLLPLKRAIHLSCGFDRGNHWSAQ